jgi:NAD+ synthase (glutamine-hydrolysing)
MRVKAGNIASNLRQISSYIKIASQAGCQGIVFPEMCVSGYFLGDRWESGDWLAEIHAAHNEILKMSRQLWIVFGSLAVMPNQRNEDGRPQKINAAFVAHNEKWICHESTKCPFFPKVLSPNYRVFDDSRHFTDLRKMMPHQTADELCVGLGSVKLADVSFGLSICEDLWEENYTCKPTQMLASQHKLVFNLSCSPYSDAKDLKRLQLLKDSAQQNQTTICYLNSVGTQNVGKTVLGIDGQSTIMDPSGEVICEGGFFDEELLMIDWNNETSTAASAGSVLVKKSESGAFGRSKFGAIENTLRFLCEEWRVKSCLIGLSGGIDSALSAVLFSRILGPNCVNLINMPSKFNSKLTQEIAQTLALNLNCHYEQIGIQNAVDFTIQQLKSSKLSQLPGFQLNSWVMENIQARDRSSRILASVAAATQSVFPCNANKTETTVGYSTLYGDQSGFLCPLADLWKFEIYEMAQLYNDAVFGSEIVPKSCMTVVPSAELSELQDVTKGLGDPLHYPYHDKLFRSWTERWDRWTPLSVLSAYAAGTLEKDIDLTSGLIAKLFPNAASFVADLDGWWSLYTGMAAVKRMQAPPVLSVSRRSFGWDHREALGIQGTGPLYEELKRKILSV